MSDDEKRRARVARHETKLADAGVKKITFRMPADARHALTAYAMTRGLSENAVAILAIIELCKPPETT